MTTPPPPLPYKVGQVIWIGQDKSPVGYLATITKVGRKIVTFESGEKWNHEHQFRIDTGHLHPWVKDGVYSSDFRVFWNPKDHLDFLESNRLWICFRRAIDDQFRRPDDVVANYITDAAKLLGIKL